MIENLGSNGMIWGLFAFTMALWFAAIFFIIRGLSAPGEEDMEAAGVEGFYETAAAAEEIFAPAIAPQKPASPPEPVWPEPRPAPPRPAPARPAPQIRLAETEQEIEIPIGESLPQERPPEVQQRAPLTPIAIEGFFNKFGKTNIVEFPAEYVNDTTIRGVDGRPITVVDFAKNCYREIGFACVVVMTAKELGHRTLRVSIFDLLSSHYAYTDDDFIGYFGELREKFDKEVRALASHPETTLRNQRALAGKYEGMPQLLVWNEKELFLVLVKARKEGLRREEIDFLNDNVVSRGLLKARIFKVTEKPPRLERFRETKEERPEPPRPEPKEISIPPAEKPIVIERAAQQMPVPEIRIVRPERPVEKPVEKPVVKAPAPEPVKAAPLPVERPQPPRREAAPKAGPKKKSFTPGEVQFMFENRDKMTNEEIARHLGRSLDSVCHKLSRLNIARESYDWAPEKDDFLRVNLTKLTYRELAEQLGTTVPSVRARCKKLGIKK